MTSTHDEIAHIREQLDRLAAQTPFTPEMARRLGRAILTELPGTPPTHRVSTMPLLCRILKVHRYRYTNREWRCSRCGRHKRA